MALGGIVLLYFGYQLYHFSIILLLHPIFGILIIVLGILSLCASLPIWLQKSWATKAVAGVGIAVCATHAIFGYYLMIAFFGLWYWAVTDYIKKSRVTQSSGWDDT